MILSTFTGAALAGGFIRVTGPESSLSLVPLFSLAIGTTISAVDVALVGGVLIVLAAGAAKLVAFFQLLWPRRNPPIEVEFATKAEVKSMIAAVVQGLKADQDKIEDKLSDVQSTMYKGFQDLRHDGSTRASSIHKRIDDVSDAVSGVRQVLELITKNLRVNFSGEHKS